MDADRIETLKKAYADFPGVQRLLEKLATRAPFRQGAGLYELILVSLEEAIPEMGIWDEAQRNLLDQAHATLYRQIVQIDAVTH